MLKDIKEEDLTKVNRVESSIFNVYIVMENNDRMRRKREISLNRKLILERECN